MQTNENLDFIRQSIQREFIVRCKKNKSYSLRAFAKYLEVDQSFLSKILKGQRPVTKNLAFKIGPKLGLKVSDLNSLLKPAGSDKGYLTLQEDEFEFLSEWYHFAIMELSKTKDFELNYNVIAKRLGIHKQEAEDAVSRLVRLGFLKIEDSGIIKLLTPSLTWSSTQNTSMARKKLQKVFLEKSIDALEHTSFDIRENGSLTVAINKKRLPEFKEKLVQVRKELSDYFQPDSEKNLDEVYQLTVSFFPISKLSSLGGENE